MGEHPRNHLRQILWRPIPCPMGQADTIRPEGFLTMSVTIETGTKRLTLLNVYEVKRARQQQLIDLLNTAAKELAQQQRGLDFVCDPSQFRWNSGGELFPVDESRSIRSCAGKSCRQKAHRCRYGDGRQYGSGPSRAIEKPAFRPLPTAGSRWAGSGQVQGRLSITAAGAAFAGNDEAVASLYTRQYQTSFRAMQGSSCSIS